MPLTYVVERAISPSDGVARIVVADSDYRLHIEASDYLASLRSVSRSPNTERAYAGRIALFLTYSARNGIEWPRISLPELGQFMRWLVTEPLPSRGGAERVRLRQAGTANAIVTTVCEFLRYGHARGWISEDLVNRLSERKAVRHVPGYDAGEDGQFRFVNAKTLKLSAYPAPFECPTPNEVDSLIEATTSARDRLLVSLLALTGVRIGEALGMRREDMHLLASGARSGCTVEGPHVHVRRRINANRALAKSRYPRSIPVTDDLVGLYAEYRHERFALKNALDTDMVFVNMSRPPLGAGMRYNNAKRLFDRLSLKIGVTIRPHMLRHYAATQWLDEGVSRDVVQELLGHASPVSMEPYLHPTDAAKRAAVKRIAQLRSTSS